jgi:hypothetical protein
MRQNHRKDERPNKMHVFLPALCILPLVHG